MFHELLDVHINNALKKFKYETVNFVLLRKMHTTIFKSIKSIFYKSSNYRFSEKSLTWLFLQYFKAIKINVTDVSIVVALVVTNEPNLSDLPYYDIKLLYDLFSETEIASELKDELARRKIIS